MRTPPHFPPQHHMRTPHAHNPRLPNRTVQNPPHLAATLPNAPEHDRTQSNTAEHSRTPPNTIEHSRTQPNTTEHSRTQSNTIEHDRTQPNTIEHHRTQPNTTEHSRTQPNTTEHNRTQPNTAEQLTRAPPIPSYPRSAAGISPSRAQTSAQPPPRSPRRSAAMTKFHHFATASRKAKDGTGSGEFYPRSGCAPSDTRSSTALFTTERGMNPRSTSAAASPTRCSSSGADASE